MLLVDTVERVIMADDELKLGIARSRPHSQWLDQLITLDHLKKSFPMEDHLRAASLSGTNGVTNGHSAAEDIRKRLTLFNYSLETLSLLLVPMFTTR